MLQNQYCNIGQSVLKMKKQADPLLLSLLEKIANPLTELDLTIALKGVYAPAEQWKQSDQANPNIFTYTLDIYGNQFAGGKIQPRKLTEKEIKEQQQAKNKKASKKQAKQEEKPQQEDPEEEKRKKEWEALPEQQKFYRTQEDQYKAFSLLWTDKTKEQKLTDTSLRNLQDAVSKGHLDIVLTRKPQGGQQEIAKLKKAKSKTLNLGQLYSAQYTGKINLQPLSVPGSTTTTQRVPVQFLGDPPPQCIKIETDKCYALVQITMSQPINPLVQEQKPTTRELLGQVSSKQSGSPLLPRLKEQIQKGMRAISQEYAIFFARQKDHTSEDRRMNTSNNTNLLTVSTLRINQISKRKEQFLSQFSSSGKYTLLKQRLTKTIKTIVIDRCRKQRCGATIARQQLHQILSQLNVYLRQMTQKVLDQAISLQAAGLHQDLVLGHQYNRSARKQSTSGVSQSKQERENRLAQEYQIINKVPQAQEKFINLVVINNNSLQSLQSYARFCLRHAFYDKAYALYNQIANQSQSFKHQLVLSFFKAQRNREDQAITVLNQLIQGQASHQDKALLHNLLSFLYQRLKQEKKAQKHQALAQKYFQMKSNPHLKINPPKNPYLQPTPRIPKPGKYISQLSQSQSQQLRFNLMNYLIDYGFYQLAKDYLKKFSQSDKKNTILAQILVSQQKYDQALTIVQKLLQKNQKSIEWLMLKSQICFLSQRLFECEQVFLILLRLKPSVSHCYSIYLRLGLTYLNRKSWQDAKMTFNKAVQLKPNSAGGWLGLGIANLNLSQLQQSEQALNLSSIYNPLSSQTAQYLKQISIQIDSHNNKTYQYLATS